METVKDFRKRFSVLSYLILCLFFEYSTAFYEKCSHINFNIIICNKNWINIISVDTIGVKIWVEFACIIK